MRQEHALALAIKVDSFFFNPFYRSKNNSAEA